MHCGLFAVYNLLSRKWKKNYPDLFLPFWVVIIVLTHEELQDMDTPDGFIIEIYIACGNTNNAV